MSLNPGQITVVNWFDLTPERKKNTMRYKIAVAFWVLIGAGILPMPSISYGQAQSAATSVISGAVTTDKGEVRAVRVKATDTVRKIAYTVFTNKGKYQIYNLPSSAYQISALQ